MSQLNKRMKGAASCQRIEEVFRCPVCRSSMQVSELKSLICSKNHTFDFAKQGYINLTTRQVKTHYDVELFSARRNIMVNEGFFHPVQDRIVDWMNQHVPLSKEPALILDTGCGEGSHLAAISKKLNREVIGIGVDLSKEGIITAAKHYEECIWTVADLARAPFKDHAFAFILNILSPSNYHEFHRLLNKGGTIIKIVPQHDYLREIRDVIFQDEVKQEYSNKETVALFEEHFSIQERIRVKYVREFDQAALKSLIKMTPLTWNATEEELEPLFQKKLTSVTVDVDILIGQ